MKRLPEILIILGAFFLIAAVLARFVGAHQQYFGIRLYSFLALANSFFLLAILAKLFEKK